MSQPDAPLDEPASLLEAVQATAMLADVTLMLWGAERTDRKIMEDAKAQAGAVGDVGRAMRLRAWPRRINLVDAPAAGLGGTVLLIERQAAAN